jgi:hypothetical protein
LIDLIKKKKQDLSKVIIFLLKNFLFQNIIFYIVSDDPDWCKENLERENVFFAGSAKTSSTAEVIDQRGT